MVEQVLRAQGKWMANAEAFRWDYCYIVGLYPGGEGLSAYVFNNPVLESTMFRQAPVNLYLRVLC